ncbi:MAG TPA: hypothetical protein VGM88_05140 [Kofleriaceae bacterium]|jgi:proteasome lid subunit RPN8/RPN11
MKEQAAAEQVEQVQAKAQSGGALAAQLPADVAATIGQATPEMIAGMIGAHPQLTDPIFWVVQQLRGNGFAQQVLAIGPTVPPQHQEETQVAAPAAEPKQAQVAPKTDDTRMNAAWNQISGGKSNHDHAWSAVRLPPDVVKQIEHYWQESLKDGNEHGGEISRTDHLGRLKNYEAESYDKGEIDPVVDLAWHEHELGIIHTHPEPNLAEHHSCYSWDDCWNIISEPDQHMSILRSGDVTYMLVRTEQTDAKYRPVDDTDAEWTMRANVQQLYNTEFANTQEGLPSGDKGGTGKRWTEASERAVFKVAQQYGLLFYKGMGADLQLVTAAPDEVSDQGAYKQYLDDSNKYRGGQH